MSYDPDEQEQIESLKAWWRKYGNFLLTVATLILAAAAAWQGWQWYERNQTTKASGYFDALSRAVQTGEVARMTDASNMLRQDFAATPYAARGALVAASGLEAAGDIPAAQGQLEWLAASKDATPDLRAIARLRLAGLLLDAGEFDRALNALGEAPPDGPLVALFADRRGDILVAQGKPTEARAAWEAALASLGDTGGLSGLLRLKIDALAGPAA